MRVENSVKFLEFLELYTLAAVAHMTSECQPQQVSLKGCVDLMGSLMMMVNVTHKKQRGIFIAHSNLSQVS